MADQPPTAKRLAEQIRNNYARDRKLICDKIVEAKEPESQIDLTNAIRRSQFVLGNYVTLDWKHRSEIISLRKRINDYAGDPSRTRPLNILMQADPGSGKSHFIKCLARTPRLRSTVGAVTFNMSGMQSVEDLIQPLEAVRNLKVIDKTPILFLDEFDSNEANYPLLLPLLWDGELHIGHRDLKTGKIVIILAGSGQSIQEAMKSAKTMQKTAASSTKLPDLLSRINGGEFSIPDLDEVSGERDRRTDKVCIAATLLMNRYGDRLFNVPWSLLHFVSVTRFRYGIRSLTHFIEFLPPPTGKDETVKLDTLPLSTVAKLKNSSLAYHLINDDGPAAIVSEWKESSENDGNVVVAKEEEEDEIPF